MGFDEGRQLFAGGNDVNLFDVVERTLSFDVEEAHGIDFVVEEFDANRVVCTDREDVDDAAATGGGSGLFDGWLDFVSGARQVAHGLSDIDAVADLDLAEGFVKYLGFDGTLCDGLDGGD